jgi:type I restriction enzyme R subunit
MDRLSSVHCPNTCLIKLRQLGEYLAQMLAARSGLYASQAETQYDLLRRLQDDRNLPREIYQLFSEIRRAGNEASHALTGGQVNISLSQCRDFFSNTSD